MRRGEPGGGRGGRMGSTSCTPSKDFKKLGYKNAIKYKNIRTPYFFTSPYTP
jgi:hypothetical protein